MSELLEGLNAAQLEAVTTTEGYIRVIAGAGTGKTRALTHRFAYLVDEIGIPADSILCVTFTNKAANEMRQRIKNLIGDNDTGYICTFHSFCVSVMQEDGYAVQYPKSFLVLDNSDIDSMLAMIYEERGLTLKDKTFKDARDMFEIRKCITEPKYYEDMIAMPLDILRQKYMQAQNVDDILFYGYLYQEKKCFGLDYNDLLKFTLYIFETNPSIREKWQKKLEYIMVDEYQDIDEIQYQLMKVLSGYNKNLFVVGDPDQTIYTWRGASIKYILNFPDEFPGAKTIMMMDNYRSTPEVLDAANELIDKNNARIKKDLLPTRESGPKPEFYHARNTYEEAKWIADRISALHDQGVLYKDMAILYRAHYVSRSIEEIFIKQEIPYRIYSGVNFYDRAEIKDALSYLRLILLKDDLSLARIINKPKRNIGNRRLKALRDLAEEKNISLYSALEESLDTELFRSTGARKLIDLVEEYSARIRDKSISELLGELLEKAGYEEALRTEGDNERLDNLAELKQSIYEFETTSGEEIDLQAYMLHIATFTNMDREDPGDKVKLMTIHAAKGLEFPRVFIASLDEGVLPSKKTATIDDMEEERRLCFVAATRAMDGLYLSDSEGQAHDGSFRYPSRFILDMGDEKVLWINRPEEGLIESAKKAASSKDKKLRPLDSKIFPVGTRVRHPIMGQGKVTGIDDKAGAYIIRFDEIDTERKIRFTAKIEKAD